MRVDRKDAGLGLSTPGMYQDTLIESYKDCSCPYGGLSSKDKSPGNMSRG